MIFLLAKNRKITVLRFMPPQLCMRFISALNFNCHLILLIVKSNTVPCVRATYIIDTVDRSEPEIVIIIIINVTAQSKRWARVAGSVFI